MRRLKGTKNSLPRYLQKRKSRRLKQTFWGAEVVHKKARRTPLKKKHLKKRMEQPVNFAENSTKNSSIPTN